VSGRYPICPESRKSQSGMFDSSGLTSPAVFACLQAALLLACAMALLARPMHPLRGSLKSPAGARLYSGCALFATSDCMRRHASPCEKIPFETPFDLRASQSWHWNIENLGHHPTISDGVNRSDGDRSVPAIARGATNASAPTVRTRDVIKIVY
jgi:hypothetical protein